MPLLRSGLRTGSQQQPTTPTTTTTTTTRKAPRGRESSNGSRSSRRSLSISINRTNANATASAVSRHTQKLPEIIRQHLEQEGRWEGPRHEHNDECGDANNLYGCGKSTNRMVDTPRSS